MAAGDRSSIPTDAARIGSDSDLPPNPLMSVPTNTSATIVGDISKTVRTTIDESGA